MHLVRDIHVPGYGGTEVRPYRRPVASDLHRSRAAAVRASLAASGEGAGAGADLAAGASPAPVAPRANGEATPAAVTAPSGSEAKPGAAEAGQAAQGAGSEGVAQGSPAPPSATEGLPNGDGSA